MLYHLLPATIWRLWSTVY